MSLPSLGAWIETSCLVGSGQGERRSLHWERGLKLSPKASFEKYSQSLPSLGAWIETRAI